MHPWLEYLCLGAHAQGRYTVVCVCVCRLLQLLNDKLMKCEQEFTFSWIAICGFAKSFSSYGWFAYLECHCSLFRKVRSETCP